MKNSSSPGQGRPFSCLYLHGFLSSPGSAKAAFFRKKLARFGIALQVPDLNAPDFSSTTITRQMEVVRKTLKTLPDPYVLIGSSLGGFLACLVAEQEPAVQKLVLLAPAFRFYERHLQWLKPAQLESWRREGYLRLDHYGTGQKKPLHLGFLEDAAQYQRQQFLRQLPVLIFHGLHDEVVPYALSLEYVTRHPQSSAILFPSDHQLLDVLEPIWRHMAAFLDLPVR